MWLGLGSTKGGTVIATWMSWQSLLLMRQYDRDIVMQKNIYFFCASLGRYFFSFLWFFFLWFFFFFFFFQSFFWIESSSHISIFWHEISQYMYYSTWIPKSSITLPTDGDSLNFLEGGEPACFYCFDWIFHYENTSMYSNILKTLPLKNENFQIKVLVFSTFLLKT